MCSKDTAMSQPYHLNTSEMEMMAAIRGIRNELDQLKRLKLEALEPGQGAILIVDMIQGFTDQGALASERIGALVAPIASLLESAEAYQKVFICDRHQPNAPEFDYYPNHAVIGSVEAEISEHLKPYRDSRSCGIEKNSTNGLNTEALRNYIESNQAHKWFLLVGDCTDICVLQLALGIKSMFHEQNKPVRIIVPTNLVDTFDLKETQHHAELMNLFALYNMKLNGIELFKEVLF